MNYFVNNFIRCSLDRIDRAETIDNAVIPVFHDCRNSHCIVTHELCYAIANLDRSIRYVISSSTMILMIVHSKIGIGSNLLKIIP